MSDDLISRKALMILSKVLPKRGTYLTNTFRI